MISISKEEYNLLKGLKKGKADSKSIIPRQYKLADKLLEADQEVDWAFIKKINDTFNKKIVFFSSTKKTYCFNENIILRIKH